MRYVRLESMRQLSVRKLCDAAFGSAAPSYFSTWCLFLLVRRPKGHNFPWMIEHYPNVTHVAVCDITGH